MLARVPDSREQYSLDRLASLRDKLQAAATLLDGRPLSVYVTGSYGRLEAWSGSDIDVFFLDAGAQDDAPFPFTTFVRLAAALVEATEELEFPPFTGDGEYLEIQDVSKMERILGSRDDDASNAFTARMLLLLESRPLLNDAGFDQLLDRVIGFYYRDFPDNRDSFLPTFLLNDILRFWRTLTLNYEHHRLQLLELTGAELEAKKAKSALKNYKLKISRLATCFSMIAHLSSADPPVTHKAVRALCDLTPFRRFEALRGRTSRADALLDDLAVQYETFLALAQRDEDVLLEHFSDSERRQEALGAAAGYGDTIYALLRELTPDDRMRRLVV